MFSNKAVYKCQNMYGKGLPVFRVNIVYMYMLLFYFIFLIRFIIPFESPVKLYLERN